MTGNKLYFLPVLLFAVLIVFLGWRLELMDRGNMPNVIPSAMIGKQAPSFVLHSPLKKGRGISSDELKGKITLIDVFASWCVQCLVEHPVLEQIKGTGITLVGIDYKDKPEDARAWLIKHGNPYEVIGSDNDGHVAIDFGVYGAPESYLVDKQGVIRFKQTGPLTDDIIKNTIIPMAREFAK